MIKSNSVEWRFILKYITLKSVLSEKPLSIKKQKQILADKQLGSSAQLLILTLLQKGQWINLYGSNRGTVITSTEEDQVKCLVQQRYETCMHMKHLVPLLVVVLPHLFPCSKIRESKLIQRVIDQVVEPSDEMIGRLKPMVMNQPEQTICYLLMQVVQQNDPHQFAYNMLSQLLSSNTEQTLPILQENLLSVVKQSNQACELLIKCMDYAGKY